MRHLLYTVSLILLALITTAPYAEINVQNLDFVGAKEATGVVYWDTNSNGEYDKDELSQKSDGGEARH
ncbi:MAG: hypothetical protein ACXACD_20225 [Candidatus Thorarchaeota archaeon]|jgi:hypothetical protein